MNSIIFYYEMGAKAKAKEGQTQQNSLFSAISCGSAFKYFFTVLISTKYGTQSNAF